MSDRTIEYLVHRSCERLAEAAEDLPWLRGALFRLFQFHDERDTDFGRMQVVEILLRCGYYVRLDLQHHADLTESATDLERERYVDPPLLYVETGTRLWSRGVKAGAITGSAAQGPVKVPLAEVAAATCRAAERHADHRLIGTWYKVLGTVFGSERPSAAVLKGAAGRDIRALAQRHQAQDVPVDGYELTDIDETPLSAWWFTDDAPAAISGISVETALAYLRELDGAHAPATRWHVPLMPAEVRPYLEFLSRQEPAVVPQVLDVLRGPSGYLTAGAAAQALVLWLKKHKRGEPDRNALGRELIQMLDTGIRIQESGAWREDGATPGTSKWIDRVSSGSDPVPLVQTLIEAYCALGPQAIPLQREVAERALQGGDELPGYYLMAVLRQKGKEAEAAAWHIWRLLRQREADYGAFIWALSGDRSVRQDIRTDMQALVNTPPAPKGPDVQ